MKKAVLEIDNPVTKIATINPQCGVKPSVSIALICTTRRRIPSSASADQGPGKGDLIPERPANPEQKQAVIVNITSSSRVGYVFQVPSSYSVVLSILELSDIKIYEP